MSNEIAFRYLVTGQSLVAMIRPVDQSTRWNGSALAADSSISDAAWDTGLIGLTETVTSDATATMNYVGTFPAALPAGLYMLYLFLDGAKAPASTHLATQLIEWNGSTVVGPGNVSVAALVTDSITAAAIKTDAVAEIANGMWQLAGAIDGKTPQQALRYMAAVLAGKITDAGVPTETFLGLDEVTERVQFTVDTDGNRTGVTYDPT